MPARTKADEQINGPAVTSADWDAVAGEETDADQAFENGDFRYEDGAETPEEDDDNPFGKSDEALPDDREERAISRDNAKSGERADRS